MSDLNLFNMLTESWSSYPLVIAVMFASFAGSSHCMAMCGPVAILLKKNKGNIHLYNFGRLVTYVFLGFVAGTIGKEFLNSHYGWVSTISTVLISTIIIYLGLNLVLKKNAGLHLPNIYSFLFSNSLQWIFRLNVYIRSLLLGIINGFIPCGWAIRVCACFYYPKEQFYGGFADVFLLGGNSAVVNIYINCIRKGF